MTPRQRQVIGFVAFAAFAVFVFVLPEFVSDFKARDYSYVGIYLIALVGLNILTGYTGQISLGHGAFMAIGGIHDSAPHAGQRAVRRPDVRRDAGHLDFADRGTRGWARRSRLRRARAPALGPLPRPRDLRDRDRAPLDGEALRRVHRRERRRPAHRVAAADRLRRPGRASQREPDVRLPRADVHAERLDVLPLLDDRARALRCRLAHPPRAHRAGVPRRPGQRDGGRFLGREPGALQDPGLRDQRRVRGRRRRPLRARERVRQPGRVPDRALHLPPRRRRGRRPRRALGARLRRDLRLLHAALGAGPGPRVAAARPHRRGGAEARRARHRVRRGPHPRDVLPAGRRRRPLPPRRPAHDRDSRGAVSPVCDRAADQSHARLRVAHAPAPRRLRRGHGRARGSRRRRLGVGRRRRDARRRPRVQAPPRAHPGSRRPSVSPCTLRGRASGPRLRGRRARRTPCPEEIGAVLAEALGDPLAELVFWLPETEAYADAAGEIVRSFPATSACAARSAATTSEPRCCFTIPTLARAERPARRRARRRRALDRDGAADASRSASSSPRWKRRGRRIVEAGYEERRRLERDLHDGAQQRLVSLGVQLRRLQLAPPTRARKILSPGARPGRRRGRGGDRRPPPDRGGRTSGPARRRVSPRRCATSRGPLRSRSTSTCRSDRVAASVEAAAYFVACEAFTNAVKHGSPSRVALSGCPRRRHLARERLRRRRGRRDSPTWLGARRAPRSGRSTRRNVRDRQSRAGGGTRVEVAIPCES